MVNSDSRLSLRGLLNPREQTARHIDAHDRAALVTGEETALPSQSATGNDVLVLVAGQQADAGGREVWGRWGLRRRTNLRPDPDIESDYSPISGNVDCHEVVFVVPDDLPGPCLVIGE